MSPLSLLAAGLVVLGSLLLGMGALSLVRFTDPLLRLHGVSKAAFTGLSLTVLGLMLQAGSVFTALKLLFIGGLALLVMALQGQAVGQCLMEARRRS